MTDITENSGIKDKNMMLIYGYICMGIGIVLTMGLGLLGVLGYMVSPIVGVVVIVAAIALGSPFLIGGLVLAVMFRKSF